MPRKSSHVERLGLGVATLGMRHSRRDWLRATIGPRPLCPESGSVFQAEVAPTIYLAAAEPRSAGRAVGRDVPPVRLCAAAAAICAAVPAVGRAAAGADKMLLWQAAGRECSPVIVARALGQPFQFINSRRDCGRLGALGRDSARLRENFLRHHLGGRRHGH